MTTKPGKIGGAAMIATGIILFFGVYPFLQHKYMLEATRVYREETGNIYPYLQHGVTIYYTYKQKLILGIMPGLGVITAMCGVMWVKKS